MPGARVRTRGGYEALVGRCSSKVEYKVDDRPASHDWVIDLIVSEGEDRIAVTNRAQVKKLHRASTDCDYPRAVQAKGGRFVTDVEAVDLRVGIETVRIAADSYHDRDTTSCARAIELGHEQDPSSMSP